MNKIQINISSTAGDFQEEFPENQPLHAVKKRAMAQLGLDPSQENEFNVVLNGVVLDEDKKLNELGLQNGTTLFLERKEIVKV